LGEAASRIIYIQRVASHGGADIESVRLLPRAAKPVPAGADFRRLYFSEK
jgi:hypothetical protein